MPRSERAVLDVLFPEVRAKLLRSFFARPPKQHYVRELVNASGLTLHTVQDELRKLSTVGLLTSWSNGYHRFYRANRDHQMYPKLVAIVQLSETLPRAKSSALARPPGPIRSENADPTQVAVAAVRPPSELASVRATAKSSTALSRRV
jgi:predicted transcriptional regulator